MNHQKENKLSPGQLPPTLPEEPTADKMASVWLALVMLALLVLVVFGEFLRSTN